MRYETHRRQYTLEAMLGQRLDRYNTDAYTPATYAKMRRLITRAYYRELARIFPKLAYECSVWEANA